MRSTPRTSGSFCKIPCSSSDLTHSAGRNANARPDFNILTLLEKWLTVQRCSSLFDQYNAQGENSQGVSTQLSDALIAELLQINPALQLVTRDFASQPVPHLDGSRLRALSIAAEARTIEQQQMVNYADSLIAELREASVRVIAAPIYNFTISMLKSW